MSTVGARIYVYMHMFGWSARGPTWCMHMFVCDLVCFVFYACLYARVVSVVGRRGVCMFAEMMINFCFGNFFCTTHMVYC